jgi:hypothetical protein
MDVLIGGLPAARKTDLAACSGAINQILTGEDTVLIDGLSAARMGDFTDKGTLIVGCMTVWIGKPPIVPCFGRAAQRRAALVKFGPMSMIPGLIL